MTRILIKGSIGFRNTLSDSEIRSLSVWFLLRKKSAPHAVLTSLFMKVPDYANRVKKFLAEQDSRLEHAPFSLTELSL